jgi:D-alanyl-D-alanine dipeptidase
VSIAWAWALLVALGTPATAAAAVPPGFVDLASAAPAVARDMRYAGARNFLGRPARGYGAARCLLSAQAAAALAKVEQDLAPAGLGLLVYDCYRPRRAVDDFIAWALRPDEGEAAAVLRARHYPAVPKAELFNRGYIATRSGHSRGSTVDLTLFRLASPPRVGSPAARDCRYPNGPTDSDGSLNMGTTFDCFDERAHTTFAALPAEAKRNRAILRDAMKKRGFTPYTNEWWHFTLANEPFPRTYFDFAID